MRALFQLTECPFISPKLQPVGILFLILPYNNKNSV